MRSHKKRTLLILLSAAILIKGSILILLWSDRSSISSWPKISGKAEAKEEIAKKEKDPDRPKVETGKKEEPTFKDVSTLLKVIREKERELAEKRKALEEEEQRLLLLKKDIEEKLVLLQQKTDKIQKLMAEKAEKGGDKILKLAKVFESTPPEQAGPILGSLETKVAAKILLRMNGKKAGKIWGYVNPDRAVKISQELAKINQ